ncbi:hypothetical protein [Pseudomonas frederiksbergensis]
MQTKGQTAVQLWEALTGTAVDSMSYRFTVLGQQFSLHDAKNRIKEALELGDDVITTLIIKTLTSQFAKTQSFTLDQIFAGHDKLTAQVEAMRQLCELNSDPAARDLHEEFYRYAEGALAHYRGLEPAALPDSSRTFVRETGCFVGMDAVKGFDRLTRLMICDGPPGSMSDAKLSRLVFGFDTIEQLISHAHQIPNGFSLCAIVAPRISDSYFVLVVRNGERILVLTDKGNYSHPLQEERMASRNDRYNANRIAHSHFPYELLNIQWSDKGRRAEDVGQGTMLVDSACGLRILGNLGELNDTDLLWLQLCIDQCKHHYFFLQKTEPRLATGSMFRLPHKWTANEDNFPVPADRPLHLDTRTSSELTSAFLHTVEPAWAKRRNPNIWMESKFAHLVPDDCLYIPASALNDETPLLAANPNGSWLLTRSSKQDLEQPMTGRELKNRSAHPIELRALSQTALSTPERVVADAHYIARNNQAQAIRVLVEADYRARAEEMQVWFYKAAKKNLPNLIDDLLCMNHQAVQISTPELKNQLEEAGVGHHRARRYIALEYIPAKDQNAPCKSAPIRFEKILKLANYAYFQYDCYLAKYERALLFLTLSVETVQDIMVITGLPLSRIPSELHDRGLDFNPGNSNLERIDPLSTLRNPWSELKLAFRLPLSLKAFKHYRRQRGLETPNAADLGEWARQSEFAMHQPARLTIEGLD